MAPGPARGVRRTASTLPATATGLLLLACVVPAGSSAQEPSTSRWTLGAQGRVGAAITGQPDDRPGDVTLLYGTGFQGPGFGFAGVARYPLLPFLAVQIELGVGSYRLTGFALRDGERRELALEHVAIEAGGLVQASVRIASLELFAGLGVVPRVGVSADISDTYRGAQPPDTAPGAATTFAFPLAIELGLAWSRDGLRVPIALRGAWNAAYPNRTIDRLGEWASFEDRGRYDVEHDFDLLVTIGVDVPLR